MAKTKKKFVGFAVTTQDGSPIYHALTEDGLIYTGEWLDTYGRDHLILRWRKPIRVGKDIK